MKTGKYSLYLNKVRKNLAAPGKLLLRCSTTYVPVGDLDRSPLIKEPLSKSYGDPWLPVQFGLGVANAPTLVQPSLRAKAISFGLRLASTCFRARRDPIGLAQRFPGYGYASAGDRSTLFAIFPLSLVPFMQYAG
jgi:hypothetical protein